MYTNYPLKAIMSDRIYTNFYVFHSAYDNLKVSTMTLNQFWDERKKYIIKKKNDSMFLTDQCLPLPWQVKRHLKTFLSFSQSQSADRNCCKIIFAQGSKLC